MRDVTPVLVDARNVLRSVWPNVPERELVDRIRAWAKSAGVRAVVVFDGAALDDLTDEHCTVVGTGPESADDRIVELASEQRGPFWLVTSDRELRARVGDRPERVIGGGGFVRELLALEPDS
jgi:rRNA-processing protein FCF1